MSKALSQSDVAFETERWAAAKKKLAALEAKQTAEIEPFVSECERQVDQVTARYSKKIDTLQADIDAREERIIGWLNTRTKTTTIESKQAVAEIVHGLELGNRVVDAAKLLALCKKKKVDFWQFVKLLVGKLDTKLGKAEVDKISQRESIPTKIVTIKLKD